MVADVFNPRNGEAQAGELLSSRPAWSTMGVPGQLGYTMKPCLKGEGCYESYTDKE